MARPRVQILSAVVLACVAVVARAEEEKKEEAPVSAADLGVAVMLLGSITFMMVLFYLTNLQDEQLRHYSWYVISSTISIFSAVLLFQACNGLVEFYILEGVSEQVELMVKVAHMLAWYIFLQMYLAYVSGAIGKEPQDKSLVKLQFKCWAVLLGHITGFAAINACSTLQQMVPHTPFAAGTIPVLSWGMLYLLNNVTMHIREYISYGDDGKVDEWEELWNEGTEETENDVVGLAVAFSVVQWLRLNVSGLLPNDEGDESLEAIGSHSGWECFALAGTGLLFAVLEGLRIKYIKVKFERLTPQMQNVVAMAFAWCLFFSSDWFISATVFPLQEGMIKDVTLALFVTGGALAVIFVLDKVDDHLGQDNNVEIEKIVRSIVMALGILIGFSWEKAFDVAVASVSGKISCLPQAQTKLLLAICIATLVIPAWRVHILPTVLAYQELDEEKEKSEEGEEEAEWGEGEEEEEMEIDGEPEEEDLEAPSEQGRGGRGELTEPLLSGYGPAAGSNGTARAANGAEEPRSPRSGSGQRAKASRGSAPSSAPSQRAARAAEGGANGAREGPRPGQRRRSSREAILPAQDGGREAAEQRAAAAERRIAELEREREDLLRRQRDEDSADGAAGQAAAAAVAAAAAAAAAAEQRAAELDRLREDLRRREAEVESSREALMQEQEALAAASEALARQTRLAEEAAASRREASEERAARFAREREEALARQRAELEASSRAAELEVLRGQKSSLEARNTELEQSLRRMVGELDQLKTLVGMLESSPRGGSSRSSARSGSPPMWRQSVRLPR